MRVQNNDSLAGNVEREYGTSPGNVNLEKRAPGMHIPCSRLHSAYFSQENLVGTSSRFPMKGSPRGPGGMLLRRRYARPR
jgi:hypothetical protein